MHVLFFCAWCLAGACAEGVAGGCVWTHWFAKGRFPLLFLLFLEYGKEKYSASNLNRSRLPWPFGRVNVAAAFVFLFFIGLPYDTSTVQPDIHQSSLSSSNKSFTLQISQVIQRA